MGHIVIIGNGISGVTAARHIRKANPQVSITLISAETDYFFSRTALMYVYMGHMRFKDTQPYEPQFWSKNNIQLVRDYVTDVIFSSKTLNLKQGGTLSYDQLILAVGSTPNKFGWPGEDLPGVQGLYSYQDLQLLEENTRNARSAVIVGGGLIGVELAEMLRSRDIEVTFLVRDTLFWGGVLPPQEADLITRHIREHHVGLRLTTELKEIVAGENGRVAGVYTTQGEYISCDVVGLTAGVSPNVSFLRSTDLAIDRGILVNAYLETNQPDVYAIGDCAQFTTPLEGRKALEQVWYTGRIMGETVAITITGKRTAYHPGHWFNSAKFFDIEYQTYGNVANSLQNGQRDFYWEHEGGKIALHFVFDAQGVFVGVNALGIRLRHEVIDKWLSEKRPITYVLEHLKDANFDPEFYRSHESTVVAAYNAQFGTTLQVKKKQWSRILG